MQRQNLAEICKLLNQVSVGRLFNEEQRYLMPLNEWITERANDFSEWIRAGAVSVACSSRRASTDPSRPQSFMSPTPKSTFARTSTSTRPLLTRRASGSRPTTSTRLTAFSPRTSISSCASLFLLPPRATLTLEPGP